MVVVDVHPFRGYKYWKLILAIGIDIERRPCSICRGTGKIEVKDVSD